MRTRGLLVVAVGLVLASCGSSSSSTTAGQTQPSTRPAPQGCLQVDVLLEHDIASGHQAGLKLAPIAASAVRAPEFKAAYFVAMRYRNSGHRMTGVWASSSLSGGAESLLSVDNFAKQFTVFPDAETTHQVSSADPGVAHARACLNAQ